MSTTKQQSRPTTAAERAATRVAGEGIVPSTFDNESAADQDRDVFTIAELASQYIALVKENGGTPDPRAQKVWDAARKAGHINANGEYVGPSTNGPRTDADKLLSSGIDLDGCDELMAALMKGADQDDDE